LSVFDLYLLGTSAATVELASADEAELAEVEVDAVVPLELFELLPQPATTLTTTRSGTIVLKRVAGGSMGITFPSLEPERLRFRRVVPEV
jgi:hypothetical protein